MCFHQYVISIFLLNMIVLFILVNTKILFIFESDNAFKRWKLTFWIKLDFEIIKYVYLSLLGLNKNILLKLIQGVQNLDIILWKDCDINIIPLSTIYFIFFVRDENVSPPFEEWGDIDFIHIKLYLETYRSITKQ